jgi:outer membrane immunogenic protein
MKKFLLGSVGLAAMLAGPAMAADMRLPPPPPPVAYYDWTGVYVGFGVGGVWETVNRTYPNIVAPSNFSSNDSDGIIDVHAGAQWQWGAWVLGVEAALSGGFREMRSNVGLPNPPFNGAAPANLTAVNKITNLFTVGPRLGYAWDRLMIFGTGGWASANIKGQYENANTGVEFNPDPASRGTTAGTPAAASNTWSTKAPSSTSSWVPSTNTLMSGATTLLPTTLSLVHRTPLTRTPRATSCALA